MNTNTPRTDAAKVDKNGMTFVWVEFAQELERELTEKTNDVERLRELLEKVLFELEKVPFQNPKLTPFTAHRLADRYRDQLELATLKK